MIGFGDTEHGAPKARGNGVADGDLLLVKTNKVQATERANAGNAETHRFDDPTVKPVSESLKGDKTWMVYGS